VFISTKVKEKGWVSFPLFKAENGNIHSLRARHKKVICDLVKKGGRGRGCKLYIIKKGGGDEPHISEKETPSHQGSTDK
jgi:hypothetical protein